MIYNKFANTAGKAGLINSFLFSLL